MADIDAITNERGRQYGDFRTQGEIAQSLKDYLRTLPGWNDLEFHQRESLDMIMHKVSRIMNGDPNIEDSWNDIAGYAHIVALRIPKKGG